MTRHQPQIVSKDRSAIRSVHVYKNFAANRGISHIGLGVAALNTSKTLRARGLDTEVWPCNTAKDIADRLAAAQATATRRGMHPVSHVIISAPWVAVPDLQQLLTGHHDVQFAVVSHSNIGFLAADTNGIDLLKKYMALEVGYHNFTLAGNSQKFCDAWSQMYGHETQFLPNLYDIASIKHVGQRAPWQPGHVLRVGIFGATRPLKNMVTATSAAVALAHQLKNDVEIHLSSGREEGGGSVKSAIRAIADNVPGVKLVEDGWRSWPEFRRVVGNTHVLLSPSYTESFCVVVADGIAEGVASVVSEAIDWTPRDWVANVDNSVDIARAARRLLSDSHAVSDGQAALRRYVDKGIDVWESYLVGR